MTWSRRSCWLDRHLPRRVLPGRDLPGLVLPGRDLPGRDLPGRDLPGRDRRDGQAILAAARLAAGGW
jgi:hypothetical protein